MHDIKCAAGYQWLHNSCHCHADIFYREYIRDGGIDHYFGGCESEFQ